MRLRGALFAGLVSSLTGCHIHFHIAPDQVARPAAPPAQPAPEPMTSLPPMLSTGEPPIRDPFAVRVSLKEVAPLADAEQPSLDRARSAYVRGDYIEAMRQAVRSNLRGWAVVGASACATGDREWIMRAWSSLSVAGRRRLQQVCALYGHGLSGALDSDRVAIALGSPSED
jgi:hypothetical protein